MPTTCSCAMRGSSSLSNLSSARNSTELTSKMNVFVQICNWSIFRVPFILRYELPFVNQISKYLSSTEIPTGNFVHRLYVIQCCFICFFLFFSNLPFPLFLNSFQVNFQLHPFGWLPSEQCRSCIERGHNSGCPGQIGAWRMEECEENRCSACRREALSAYLHWWRWDFDVWNNRQLGKENTPKSNSIERMERFVLLTPS